MTSSAPGKLDPDLARRITEAVDAAFVSQIEFTKELVSRPSVRGQEHLAQDLMAEAMAKRGYAVDRWLVREDDIKHHEGFSPIKVDYSNAWNVVGTHRPRTETGRSLVLNGHVDVVPEGPLDMWSSPPYQPRIEGDWMYGRGAGDMKAGVVSNMFALDALKAAGVQPAGRVHLESVCEEESTGNGALATLVRGYTADACLISEPSSGHVNRAVMGVTWFRVHVRGFPVHVATAGSGSNAILAAYDLIGDLKELEARWNARKGETRNYKDAKHPINLNVGKIEGGDWASSVPAWCSFDCRVSYFPGIKPQEMARDIEDTIRKASANHPFLSNSPPEIEFNGFFTEGYDLEPGSDAELTLARQHQAVSCNPLEERIATAYIDSRVFVLYAGIPCLVYGAHAENVHGFDERVSIESIRESTKAIALFVADWCGTEPLSA
ncbi:MAG: ArgE/DapE family deacylase [Thalassobaculaceae bacterium]